MKSTHNFSLVKIFLAIFTRAVALMKIRRKMVIREKLFINFITNGVIIYKFVTSLPNCSDYLYQFLQVFME